MGLTEGKVVRNEDETKLARSWLVKMGIGYMGFIVLPSVISGTSHLSDPFPLSSPKRCSRVSWEMSFGIHRKRCVRTCICVRTHTSSLLGLNAEAPLVQLLVWIDYVMEDRSDSEGRRVRFSRSLYLQFPDPPHAPQSFDIGLEKKWPTVLFTCFQFFFGSFFVG